NKRQVELFLKKILKHYNNEVSGKHFAMWGLAFKPNTDDVREAPAHALIKLLLDKGATISAYDPEAIETSKAVLGDTIKYAAHSYEALSSADALIIVTEWNEFRTPDFSRIKEMLKEPVIFDGRNLYDLDKMKELKFNYYSVGREKITNQVL
ncbi:MAG TPA: UDP binding domain-containing protein, partial [Ignavibacteriaceae bacterium]